MATNTALMKADDGSIYHLRLHPGELAETIILVGDPERSHLIAQYFDHVELTRTHREFTTCTGVYRGKRLSVVSTGIGAGGIDIVINEIDALFNMDWTTAEPKDNVTQLSFVRFGTTGGLQPNIAVGSLVVSAYAFATDGLLHYYTRPQNETRDRLETNLRDHLSSSVALSGLYAAPADPTWLQVFEAVATPGITFTCNGFFAPQGRVLRQPIAVPNFIDLVSSFSFEGYEMTNLEMETAVIYGLCESLGHRCCSISTVMGNRRTEALGTYTAVVQDMIGTLLDRLAQEVPSLSEQAS